MPRINKSFALIHANVTLGTEHSVNRHVCYFELDQSIDVWNEK